MKKWFVIEFKAKGDEVSFFIGHAWVALILVAVAIAVAT